MRCALLLLPLLTACGAVKFDVEQDLPAQHVDGSLLGGVLPSVLSTSPKLTIDLKSEVQKRGTGPATSARLKSLTLATLPHDTAAQTFDFISEIHLTVEGAGLVKVEIAKLAPVPRGSKTLSFDVVPDIDLLPYINAGATIGATATATQPSRDTDFDGHVIVEVRI